MKKVRRKRFKWKNLSIGFKYSLALFISIILFLISSGITVNLLMGIEQDIAAVELRGDMVAKVTELGSIFRTKDLRIADYIIYQNQELIEEYNTIRMDFVNIQTEIKLKMDSKELESLLYKINSSDTKVHNLFTQNIIPAVYKGNESEITEYRQEAIVLRTDTVNLLNEFGSAVQLEKQKSVEAAKVAIQKVMSVLIASVILASVFGIITVLIVNRLIKRNLSNVVNISNSIANGDLSIEKIKYDGNDEIGQLSVAMNSMIDSLRSMVSQIASMSSEVNAQSSEFITIADEIKQGSEQIAATMEEMTAGVEEQSSSSMEVANSTKELNVFIKESTTSGESLGKSSEEILSIADDGNNKMSTSVKNMDSINIIVKDSLDKVKGLDTKTQEISKLALVITEIADQTNLLALNAAIEAARAGEAGQGFAVVADEIRKLAVAVSNSLDEISSIVTGIQNESKEVAQSLESGYKEVNLGTEQIRTTGESFENINAMVKEMVFGIQNVTNNLRKASENSQYISESINQVAEIAEENSAGIEQSSAAIQQQTSSMENVLENAQALSCLSKDLNSMIEKFRL